MMSASRKSVYLLILSLGLCVSTSFLKPSMLAARVTRQPLKGNVVRATGSSALRSRLVRLQITRRESVFGGMSFGTVGPYEKVVGTMYLQADPNDPQDAIIQDLNLASRNPGGMVEYQGDFYILKPVEMAKSNGILLHEANLAGNKNLLVRFNRAPANNDPTTAADAGDGLLQKMGYTIAWCGFSGLILPGGPQMSLTVPVPSQGGAPITGVVRQEFIVNAKTAASQALTWEAVSSDTSSVSLTARVREADPRVAVAKNDWAFANCSTVPFPGTPSTTQLCLKDGFDPNFIYELLYTAKNPKVLGLGFTAVRDFVSFLRYGTSDDQGTPNPLNGAIRYAVHHANDGNNQVTPFVDLGFNQDTSGRRVFDGMFRLNTMLRAGFNYRFGTNKNLAQHESHLFPGNESPRTWASVNDPVAGYTAGLLDRCQQTGTCPKIMASHSSVEYWFYQASRATTDALGQRDLPIPTNVRIYMFSSSAVPNSDQGICQQLRNPNDPYGDTLRALLPALQRWIIDGVDPPPSQFPTLRDGTLVRPDKASVKWPDIPGVKYTGLMNDPPLLDFGPQFNPRTDSGIVTEPPKVVAGPSYVRLVPKVDADGNDIAGIRTTTIQAPIGTYTGWNLRRAGFAEDEMCGAASGSFIPFAKTQAERLAKGDPRLSLQERYGTHDGYVAAVRAATERLMAQGSLLPEDAQRRIQEAISSDVLK